jgi:hypothetical protein
MFNEISRDACRLLLLATPELKDMVPHFDQTHKEPNRCWCKTDKGACRHFQQPEGFAQGCPLSESCAAIALSLLLKKINEELIARQNQNSDIPSPHASSFIDDTNPFLPLQDVEWFIKRFDKLGRPTGIRLNQRKTQLLVGPRTHTSAKQQEMLTHLTTILQPENTLTEGCKLLGQAIGTGTHVTNCMKQQATKCRTAASRITTRLLDRQTISSICRCCAQPAVAHLIGTDILNACGKNGNPPPGDPTKWKTPFLNAIKTKDSFFLRFITDTNENNLPLHASLIATIPAKDGGLGYRHPQRAALGAFAVPMARTIKHALQGPQIGSDPDTRTTLAADHRCAFETLTMQTAPTNPWKHIDSMARTINTQITRNETDTPHADISKAQTQQRFYQTMTTAEFLTQTPLIPKDTSSFLPSLLSPLTSIALPNRPRSEP